MRTTRVAAGVLGGLLAICGAPATGGLIDVTGFRMPSGAAAGYVLTCDAAGVATWQPAPGGTGGNDGDWTVLGTNIHAAVSGNVGIGTNAPSAKLDVVGNVAITGGLTVSQGITLGGVERTTWPVADGAGDHGALTGLEDDDHPHYLNEARGDARYVNEGQPGSIAAGMLQNNSVMSANIIPNLLSSLDGVSNDGGNVDLVEGPGITITPDNAGDTITIGLTDGGHDHFTESWSGSWTKGLEVINTAIGGYGLAAEAKATTGYGMGVYARTYGDSGRAVYGLASSYSGTTYGVYGEAYSTNGVAVHGHASGNGQTYGVEGSVSSGDGVGVEGYNSASSGNAHGVKGVTISTSGRAVQGSALASTGVTTGVYGYAVGTSGRGVYGTAVASSGTTYGVYGWVNSTSGTAVYGRANSSSGSTYGVYGSVASADGYSGFFQGGRGVYVSGSLTVTGNLTASGTKNFVQEHPEDPTKEIVYVALEGPEAGTYVRGSAELRHGEATVELPDHFGLVTNTEGLTVQLTPVGQPLVLYVVEQSPTRLVVREGSGRSGRFHYLVQGVRKGYENHQVIRSRAHPAEPDKLVGAR